MAYTGSDELPLDGESASWLVSLCVHLAVLVLLATVAFFIPTNNDYLLTVVAAGSRRTVASGRGALRGVDAHGKLARWDPSR